MTRQMADDEVLRPCPWCGVALNTVTVSEGSSFRWRKVDGCCADGPEVRHHTTADDQESAEADSRRRAIAAWNDQRAVLAPQAERDALRAKTAVTLGVGSGGGSLFVHGDYDSIKAAQDFIFRAERAESALEALRGQVAGLLNTCVDVIEEGLCASQSYDYRARAEGCAEQIKELLAIKERMG